MIKPNHARSKSLKPKLAQASHPCPSVLIRRGEKKSASAQIRRDGSNPQILKSSNPQIHPEQINKSTHQQINPEQINPEQINKSTQNKSTQNKSTNQPINKSTKNKSTHQPRTNQPINKSTEQLIP